MLVWGGWEWAGDGVSGPLGDGAAYDPATGDWLALPRAPLARARHIAAWTGEQMLVWGGFSPDGAMPPDGAAYIPATREWRTIRPSPVSWTDGAAAAWAHEEWIIAIARPRKNEIEVIAYNPALDQWRDLPGLHGPYSDENQLVWTGSELLLVNVADGLYRLDEDELAWIASPTPAISGPGRVDGRSLAGRWAEGSLLVPVRVEPGDG